MALVLTAALAWWRYRGVPWIIVPATAMIVLLAIQIGLGGVVVLTELQPLLVATHLGVALLVFTNVIAIAVFTTRPTEGAPLVKGTRAQLVRLGVTLAALFIVLMLGAVVVGSNTTMACPEWPICNTAQGVIVFPPPALDPRIWFILAHRYSVALFSVGVAWVVYRTLKEQGGVPEIRLWTILLAAFFVLQVAAGAVQVLTQQPALLRALHLAVAAAVLVSLVVLTLLTYLGARPPKALA